MQSIQLPAVESLIVASSWIPTITGLTTRFESYM